MELQYQAGEALSPELKARIVKQIDYYFLEDNLCKDSHLLAKLEEGNGKVEIKEVHGWRTNRTIYKNANTKWKSAVNESTVVEIVDKKYIRRRVPFDMAKAKVKPVANDGREVRESFQQKKKYADILAANPHLTRGMLDLTGFERDQPENPLSDAERARNAEEYDPKLPITLRIETAIVRYRSVRKMHQETVRLFEAFLAFCGFETRENAFTGGMSKEEQEDLTKDEIALRRQTNFVAADVVESLEEGDGKWIIDFPGVMKGFFSTRYPTKFDALHSGVMDAACNVLRNFHKYLRRNEVCPEYTDQIEEALNVIDVAEVEWNMLSKAQPTLPGSFSIACSTLHGGAWANIHYTGDWQTPEEATGPDPGYSNADAKFILMAGISAFASEEQKQKAQDAQGIFKTINSEAYVGLEITGMVPLADCPEQAKNFFNQDFIKGTVVPPMGKLLCKRYKFPMISPIDVPADLPPGYEKFDFIVDEQTLDACYVGMKLEATVKELDIGFCWIDHIAVVYPSFFKWCWNERIRDYKKPGPLKAWQIKSNAKVWSIGDSVSQIEEAAKTGAEEDGSDEDPEEVNGLVVDQIDGQVDAQVNGQVDSQTTGEDDTLVNDRVNSLVDGLVEGQANGKINGSADRQNDQGSSNVTGAADDSDGDDAWFKKAAKGYFQSDRKSENGGADTKVSEDPKPAEQPEPRITLNDLVTDPSEPVDREQEYNDRLARAAAAGGHWQGDGMDDDGSLDGAFSDEDDDGDAHFDHTTLEDFLGSLDLSEYQAHQTPSAEALAGSEMAREMSGQLPTARVEEID